MYIDDRSRGDVEELLRAARDTSPVVREVCQANGARLDGTDDVLVLCAVDDALALKLTPAEHPLPVERAPWPDRRKSDGTPFATQETMRDVAAFAPPQPARPQEWTPGGYRERAFAEQGALGHWPGLLDLSDESDVDPCIIYRCLELLYPSPIRQELGLALVSRAEEEHERMRALADFGFAVVASVEDVGLGRLAFSPGAPFEWSLEQALLDETRKRLTCESTAVDEQHLAWLRDRLVEAKSNPRLLRVRSREACEITGVAGRWDRHGPASLLDAAVHWKQKFGAPIAFTIWMADARDVQEEIGIDVMFLVKQAFAALDEHSKAEESRCELGELVTVAATRRARVALLRQALQRSLAVLTDGAVECDHGTSLEEAGLILGRGNWRSGASRAAARLLRKAMGARPCSPA